MEESISADRPSATSDLEPEEVPDAELADDIVGSEWETGGVGGDRGEEHGRRNHAACLDFIPRGDF
jgi:hypothetical protein